MAGTEPSRLEQRLHLLRRLADVADRTRCPHRAGAGARGACPRHAAAAGPSARGELSYSKVRALTRVATPETEKRLLKVGRVGTAEHVERIVRGWRRVDRKAEAREATRRHRSRGLQIDHDEDGMVVVRGRLEPQTGAVLLQALAAARETLYQRAYTNRAEGGPAGPRFVDPEPVAAVGSTAGGGAPRSC